MLFIFSQLSLCRISARPHVNIFHTSRHVSLHFERHSNIAYQPTSFFEKKKTGKQLSGYKIYRQRRNLFFECSQSFVNSFPFFIFCGQRNLKSVSMSLTKNRRKSCSRHSLSDFFQSSFFPFLFESCLWV